MPRTRGTPETIPREQWEAHANYPDHVLLLGSHANFRQISRELIRRARADVPIENIEWTFDYWIGAMRSHERYEERKLYPYLAWRWNWSPRQAQEGHDELHDAEKDVRDALAQGGEDNVRDVLVAALEHHDRVLVDHLALEEEHVIPLLLQLSREEFVDYYHGRIDWDAIRE